MFIISQNPGDGDMFLLPLPPHARSQTSQGFFSTYEHMETSCKAKSLTNSLHHLHRKCHGA